MERVDAAIQEIRDLLITRGMPVKTRDRIMFMARLKNKKVECPVITKILSHLLSPKVGEDPEKDLEALAVIIYFVNPYDEYPDYIEGGLTDDIYVANKFAEKYTPQVKCNIDLETGRTNQF